MGTFKNAIFGQDKATKTTLFVTFSLEKAPFLPFEAEKLELESEVHGELIRFIWNGTSWDTLQVHGLCFHVTLVLGFAGVETRIESTDFQLKLLVF